MLFLLQVIVSGLTLGSIYALTALGFVIIFKSAGVLNFAQGDLMMVGAIIALAVHRTFGLGYFASFGIALVAAWLLGVVLQRVAYRPLVRAPVFTVILSTVAVGQILRSSVRILRGSELSLFPPILSAEPFAWHGIRLTPLNLGIIGICVVTLLAFAAFFRWTKTGWAMRAAAMNKEAAAIVGISVSRVFSVSWGLSAALAAAAGILCAPLILITPDMGIIGIKGFVAAIIGGFNSLPGAVLGGFVLGVLENLVGVYVSSAFKDVVIFGLLLVVLMMRPSGILGTPEVRRA